MHKFKQAVNWADDIKHYTANRQMPPWKPTHGPAFHNERTLSDQDLKTIADWVDGGTPKGDPKDAPKPKEFIDGWQLGKPDLTLTVAEEFTVAQAVEIYSGASCCRRIFKKTNTSWPLRFVRAISALSTTP